MNYHQQNENRSKQKSRKGDQAEYDVLTFWTVFDIVFIL